ncbi:hemagglutinin/amebocyte aggregation factor-like isoform X2 [Mizuhopecten yessoensis]|uniref:hemagglutinin/amebocyte aggregation factor-like isoform X2 n=1 Tax=Mizuhopecten yessoensis TaxID=6573 RepID=UPI000B45EC71|nr:hemagglutinin/amebocyte aggregation factor-like isoform X2 [Mizuhopecten yessoensis]
MGAFSNRKMMVCILLAGLSVTTAFVVNDYDGPMNFSCQGDTTLRHLSSSHTNYYEDRVWSVGCYPAVARLENCQWTDRVRRNCRNTGFVNSYGGDLSYTTAHAYQNFHGWTSIHNNYYEDRIFDFQVCDYVERDASGF